jgi:hypothetical protein
MSAEIEVYASQQLAQFAEGGELQTEQDYRRVEAIARECSIMIKDAKAQIAPEIKQAHALHKALKAKEKAITEPLESVKAIASKLLGAFNVRKEAEERAEQQRLAVEARRVAESEAKAKAVELVDAGEVDAAVALVDHAKNIPAELLVEKPSLKPVNHGTITRTTYDYDIKHLDLVPRKYFSLDDKLLRGDINAAKGAIDIPGIKIKSTTKTHVK